MHLKKWLLVGMLAFSTAILAACGKSAPNLTFEETLQAYNNDQVQIQKVVSLLNTPEGLLKSDFKGNLTINGGEKGNGKLLITATNVRENQTKNAESNLDLALDADIKDETAPFTGKLEWKLSLSALVKDLQVYFKLNELDLKAANEEAQAQLAFPLMMVVGFKNQWIGLDLPEIKQAIEMNQANFTLPAALSAGTKAEYFLNPTSTTYEGQPAWKVELNQENIKAEAKSLLTEIYGQMLPEEMLTGDDAKEIQAQKEETLKAILETVDGMQFENADAYFVIYPETVKFVSKNLDLKIKNATIKLTQSVTEEEDKGTIEIFWSETEDKILINYLVEEKGKGKYAFTIDFQLPGAPLVKLEGTLAYEASDERFTIKPDVKLNFEGATIQLQGAYDLSKLANYTFTTPENVKGLQDLFGGMFGGAAFDGEELDSPELELEETATE